MRELARRWLSYAEVDRRACDHLIGELGLASIVAFHAQQAIEKSYKALLVYYGQDPPRVHDLSRLAVLVASHVEDPTHDPDLLDRITQYYIQSRYPLMYEAESSAEPTVAETKAMVSHANRVLDFAKSTII